MMITGMRKSLPVLKNFYQDGQSVVPGGSLNASAMSGRSNSSRLPGRPTTLYYDNNLAGNLNHYLTKLVTTLQSFVSLASLFKWIYTINNRVQLELEDQSHHIGELLEA